MNDANLNDETALIGSGRRDAPEVTQFLIDHGAELNARTRTAYRFGFTRRGEVSQGPPGNGCTALMMAVSTSNCRPQTVIEPIPSVEAVLRTALKEQGPPDELDEIAGTAGIHSRHHPALGAVKRSNPAELVEIHTSGLL